MSVRLDRRDRWRGAVSYGCNTASSAACHSDVSQDLLNGDLSGLDSDSAYSSGGNFDFPNRVDAFEDARANAMSC